LRRFYGVTSFLRYFLVEIFSMKIKMAFATYEILGYDRRHIASPVQKYQIVIIFEKSQFDKTNFNLHYFN
jgi:hypothetical protein